MASASSSKKRKAVLAKYSSTFTLKDSITEALSIAEIVKLFNAHSGSGCYDTCEECGLLSDNIHGAETYKRETVRICESCISYCAECDTYYSAGGAYYHDDCTKDEE